ncbi:MAG: hypothetical protein GF317_06395 [Candidatus Lokiarchaeota archaeon]|nr:hypothetical protein [Candidatus Lokiarchaeota archaeon]MBD3199352.1 hypothetical protein [Candidatus Lokiarchaeota archaeon]
MPDDLKDVLDNIEESEKESAKLQEKIDRLTELVQKQKRIISEQEQIIEEQRGKAQDALEVPDDIIELKEMIGAQRALLNEREMELEHAKAAQAQAEKELELLKQQSKPLEDKYNESFETIGQLKAELAEKRSEVMIKDEKNKNLKIKFQELKTFAGKLKDEQKSEIEELRESSQREVKELRQQYEAEIKGIREEHQNEIKQLKEQHQDEKQKLQSQINELDTILLDSKLLSTEKSSEAKDFATRFKEIKEKQENLIEKVETLGDKNREKEAEIRRMNEKMQDLRDFKEVNKEKLVQFDKLTELMEQETLFKAFLIVRDVGGKGIAIEDLRKSLGAPVVIVKRHIQTLQDHDLVDLNDEGKIVVKSYEDETDDSLNEEMEEE